MEGPESAVFTAEGSSATITIADAPGVRSWIRDGDGLWDEPSNWSGGVVPQPGETVVIDRPGNITVTVQSTTASIASLQSEERLVITSGSLISSGSIALNGGLTLSGGAVDGGDVALGGTSVWTAGHFQWMGVITVNLGATLTVSSPGLAGILLRSIHNFGTVIWNQASLANGGSIVNHVTGVFEIQSNLAISGGVFTNTGRLFKSGPVGPITLTDVGFSTSGVLELRLASDTEFDAMPVERGRWPRRLAQHSAEAPFTPADGA